METIVLIFLAFLALVALAAILNTQRKILHEFKNLRIPGQQKIEFPKIEFPKIEIPPAKEVSLDLAPVVAESERMLSSASAKIIEAINNIRIPEPPVPAPAPAPVSPPKEAGISVELLQNMANTQNDLFKALQETTALMRVNQAEFQSGLEAFHKAIEKLLTQIPTGDKELNAQKEFIQKFEEAFVKVQEKSAEAMSENSLRLQEILTEVLSKEAK